MDAPRIQPSSSRRRAAVAAALFALATLAGSAAPAAEDRKEAGREEGRGAATPTLYQRFGGYDAIARFVDTAFPRVAGDPRLSRFFRGHSQASQGRQRQRIVDLICAETGGPCLYTGLDMPAAHHGLGVTDDDWKVFISILGRALDDLAVPTAEKRDLLALFESRFRPVVVESSSDTSSEAGHHD